MARTVAGQLLISLALRGEVIPSVIEDAVRDIEAEAALTQPQPDTGLREAAQAVVDRVDAIDPSFEAQPVPEIEALRAALRSTLAAPEFGGSLASVQPTPAAPQPDAGLREALTIGQMNDLIDAAEYIVSLGNQLGFDDDEWEQAFTSLEAAVASVQTAAALRAALRPTPAAPHQHRFDVVIRDDEHMRLLGCSNTPCEESYQWDR